MLSSCDSKTENKDLLEDKDLIVDMHTLSNYQDLPILNTHLELSVNFQEKKLKGSVTHRLDENRKVDILKLDSKYLKIDSIHDGNGNNLEYSFGKFDELLGSALSIILNTKSNEVVIFYETTDKSEALDWLLSVSSSSKCSVVFTLNFELMVTLSSAFQGISLSKNLLNNKFEAS